MSTKTPTTVWKLECALRKAGFHPGMDWLLSPEKIRKEMEDPTLYEETTDWKVGDVTLLANERFAEPKVELFLHVSADQMPAVAKAISEHHKSKNPNHQVGIRVICSPTVAVEISKALRDYTIGKE